MRSLLFIAAFFLIPCPVFAETREIISRSGHDVSVTIYRDELAFITETREVTLPGGPVKIIFEGVLDRALAPSAILAGVEKEERERNFDFDGLTPRSLLNRSLDSPVAIVRTIAGKEVKEKATVIAAGDGIALQFRDRVEALGCSGLPERLIFERMPPNLRARPALSVFLADAPAGKRTLTLSYLADGIRWGADYIVMFDSQTKKVDVTGLITIENYGEEGFAKAKVGVVAGELSRVWDERSQRAYNKEATRRCWPQGTTSDVKASKNLTSNKRSADVQDMPLPMAAFSADFTGGGVKVVSVTAQESAERQQLADYQLYKLADQTSLPAQQDKQVLFLHKTDIRNITLEHYVELHFYNVPSRLHQSKTYKSNLMLRIPNKKSNGLGDPLPEGNAHLFARQTNGILPLENIEVSDVAVGNDWKFEEIEQDSGFVVTIETLSRTEAKLKDRTRTTYVVQAEVKSTLPAAATIKLEQELYDTGDRVTNVSAPWKFGSLGPAWTFNLKPGETRRLRYNYVEDEMKKK